MPQKLTPRAPQHVIATLRGALAHARMESCCVDAAAQEAMRNYLDSWVAGPIAHVLAWAEGRPGRIGNGYSGPTFYPSGDAEEA